MNANDVSEIGKEVKKLLPPGFGFSLQIWETNSDKPQVRYVSNCDRASMIETLSALLEKWKNQKIEDN